MSGVVEWAKAGQLAGMLVAPGPALTKARASAYVTRLRRSQTDAQSLAGELSGLVSLPLNLRIVERTKWAQATAASAALIDPLLVGQDRPWGAWLGQLQATGVLAVASSRVVSSFDPFSLLGSGEAINKPTDKAAVPSGSQSENLALTAPGLTLVVAPNLAQVVRRWDLDADEYSTWILLREGIHAAVFHQSPWLRGLLLGYLQQFFELGKDTDFVNRIRGYQRGWSETWNYPEENDALELTHLADQESATILAQQLSEPECGPLSQFMRLIALIDSYTYAIMGQVTPAQLASVRMIRSSAETSRRPVQALATLAVRGASPRVLSRQRREVGRFVRMAATLANLEALNLIWDTSANLPRESELADARAWLRRVGA